MYGRMLIIQQFCDVDLLTCEHETIISTILKMMDFRF
jgi:hypothetical protein